MDRIAVEKELAKVEAELDKCRTTSFVDGWQTMRHARKSRKWDYWSERKRQLRDMLDAIEHP